MGGKLVRRERGSRALFTEMERKGQKQKAAINRCLVCGVFIILCIGGGDSSCVVEHGSWILHSTQWTNKGLFYCCCQVCSTKTQPLTSSLYWDWEESCLFIIITSLASGKTVGIHVLAKQVNILKQDPCSTRFLVLIRHSVYCPPIDVSLPC